MKLTKQKLEQLIIEQYKSMSRRIFDKRRQDAEDMMKSYKDTDTYIQAAGDRGMQINDPEYHEKLATLYSQDRAQATELADALDEPIYLKLPRGDLEFDEMLPYGTRQFEQSSYVTVDSKLLGYIEIFFIPHEDTWVVAFYKGTNPNGVFSFDGTKSKDYSNTKDAIQHYNSLADVPYKESEPLKKRGEGFKLQPYKK